VDEPIRSRAARRAFATIVVCLAVCLVACNAAPTNLPNHHYGDPIEPGPKPDVATCQHLLRSDIDGATRIRAALSAAGLSTDAASAWAAAADPAANTALVGIPLTAAEVTTLRRAGVAFDPSDALSYWVSSGAPERFGGMWIEDGVAMVAVVNGDAGALQLARCVEPPAAREVWADISYADGLAILSRISADRARWGPQGGPINMADYDVSTGFVDVGVTTPSALLEATLRDAYGPRIRIHQEGPAQPV
jgi:hypothetical protein